ncbi:MAG: diguanylate cyclase domain-containing protein [bacterium]
MTRDLDKLAGDIDFRELIETLDLAIVALDADWNVLYHNQKASDYFDDRHAIGKTFWENLTSTFKQCLQDSYKKAILGNRNQLDFAEPSRRTQHIDESVFSDLPLDLLDQKAVEFKFDCEQTNKAYSAAFDHHQGNFLFRIESITERVEAHRKAEKSRKELKETLEKMSEAKNANPLTGLPGNIRIQEEIKHRLEKDEDFALIYADLDNFKPFNDRYGFDRGDEALILLRDLLRRSLTRVEAERSFLGHIGGDDFVVIIDIPSSEEFCRTVIDLFDDRIPDLYDQEDREKGGIQSTNRQGETEEFTIMSITLAVVTTQDQDFNNYLEMTETAADVKHYAKQDRRTSNYVFNRRTELEPDQQ